MKRKFFKNDNRNLSYIDFGGNGEYIIMLHGHFGCASMYSALGNILKRSYRVIALDQQGHGFSEWGQSYTRREYIDDIKSLYSELNISEAIIIGHSLGGVNGYQLAAQHPRMVKSLIIEDIGTIINDDVSFILEWPDIFPTARHCHKFLLQQGIDNFLYFMESLEQVEQGWQFKFHAKGLVKSQFELNGDWTEDWQKVQCNILLMRGSNSDVLSEAHAKDLVNCTPNMRYKLFEGCGHTIRDMDFEGYKKAILEFLNGQ